MCSKLLNTRDSIEYKGRKIYNVPITQDKETGRIIFTATVLYGLNKVCEKYPDRCELVYEDIIEGNIYGKNS